MARASFLIIAIALWPACGHSRGPSGALDRYSEALRNHDFSAAYSAMSATFRAQVSKDDFVRMMRDNPREVGETVDHLGEHRGNIEVTAEFQYGLGDTMRLVQEGGDWKIASNPMAFYDQSTPRATLRSFLRALHLQRWDVMLRFVPDKYREKMDANKMKAQFQGDSASELATLINVLEANIDAPITEHGNEARMSYSDRYEAKFVREDGAWKLKDLD